jgi:hypothetical protein
MLSYFKNNATIILEGFLTLEYIDNTKNNATFHLNQGKLVLSTLQRVPKINVRRKNTNDVFGCLQTLESSLGEPKLD